MRRFVPLIILAVLLISPALAVVPSLSAPSEISVPGNGLNSAAFVVLQTEVSPEVQRSLRYNMTGGPAGNDAVFDPDSRLFFWTPPQGGLGRHVFTVSVKDPFGNEESQNVAINVTAAPTLEPLPHGWPDLKIAEKYLAGRGYLPASNYVEWTIAGLDYQVEITVIDSLDQECVLTYLPQEGRNFASLAQRTATVMLGGRYISENFKTIRRDLYEDLFDNLDLIFKKIKAIKVTGSFDLKDFKVADQLALIRATGAEEIYKPRLVIAFDDRYYEDAIYSKKEPISISDVPEIKIDVNTSSGVIWRRAKLFINEAEYSSAWGDFSLVVVKPYKEASSFDVDYAMYLLKIPSAKKLPFGEHHFVFEVENAYGQVISREAFARVVTIPAQIEGAPMVFPSPYNPGSGQDVKIQYTLSLQTNIEIVIFGGDGSTIMKKRYTSGEEGGRKGMNTVSWDGKSDAGLTVSNGIYIGVIIDRDENRILDKFRLTVFR